MILDYRSSKQHLELASAWTAFLSADGTRICAQLQSHQESPTSKSSLQVLTMLAARWTLSPSNALLRRLLPYFMLEKCSEFVLQTR